ncbi:MAG TPA: 50S ribosomal protein L6 [Candidatus Paceibacterota bacterium]
MSRIGKQLLAIPPKTEVHISGDEIRVKGPLAELTQNFRPDDISIVVQDNIVTLTPKRDTKTALSLWGTYASLIKSMITGVNQQFEKRLVVEGVGYRVEVSGKELILSVGFSHQVRLPIPDGLTVVAEKNEITISGSNKEQVGEFSAVVRSKKKPEPYKGKGIRYSDEVVRRKQGKRAVT